MANDLKHTWTTNIKNDSGTAVVADAALIVPGNAESNFSVLVDSSATEEVDLIVPVAAIQSGFITCTKAPMTIHTNAADGTGGQTIVLTVGRTFSWNNQQATTNPFTPDITKFFITNTGLVQ